MTSNASAKTEVASAGPTIKDIKAFAARIKTQAEDMPARSDDVRAVIIERLLKADTLDAVLDAAQIGLPNMEEYIGVPVQVRDFELVKSNFESSDAYALVDCVTRDGEKIVAGWGGVGVVDTLVRLREIGAIPMEQVWVKLRTKQTSNGYDVYNIVKA